MIHMCKKIKSFSTIGLKEPILQGFLLTIWSNIRSDLLQFLLLLKECMIILWAAAAVELRDYLFKPEHIAENDAL